MRKNTINIRGAIGLEDVITKKQWAGIAEDAYWVRVARVKRGDVITRGYAASTKRKRQRFGLQTSHVDLTGNTRYSKKQWRLWNQGRVVVTGIGKAHVEWKMSRAQTLYSYLTRRYGNII